MEKLWKMWLAKNHKMKRKNVMTKNNRQNVNSPNWAHESYKWHTVYDVRHE